MGLMMSSKIGREQLNTGDHIYSWRSGYSYSHHGIYAGDGKVIHLTRGPGLIIFSSSSRSQPSNDRVVCCSIQDFVSDGQLYRFEYGVSTLVFLMKRPGTCSLVYSNSPEHVLHRASYLLVYGYGDYHLLEKNCEDFALYCKTGFVRVSESPFSRSGQIKSIIAAMIAVAIIPFRFLPCNLIGLLVVCGLYCKIRVGHEAVSESDCATVEVEKLKDLSDAHNVEEKMIEKISTPARQSLRLIQFFSYTLCVIRIGYWTPESIILLVVKSCSLYLFLINFVYDYVNFKIGEYSAYTMWVLGYWYWRWRTESAILLWTRLALLTSFLRFLVSDHQRGLKLCKYIVVTTKALELWHWTPGSTIVVWIKLALVYFSLFDFITVHLINHRLMSRIFFACFVIQSAALFMGIGLQSLYF